MMKIKYDKFSFEMSPKDIEWILKLSTNDQLKILGTIVCSICAINMFALNWYKTINEEHRKNEVIKYEKLKEEKEESNQNKEV